MTIDRAELRELLLTPIDISLEPFHIELVDPLDPELLTEPPRIYHAHDTTRVILSIPGIGMILSGFVKKSPVFIERSIKIIVDALIHEIDGMMITTVRGCDVLLLRIKPWNFERRTLVYALMIVSILENKALRGHPRRVLCRFVKVSQIYILLSKKAMLK